MRAVEAWEPEGAVLGAVLAGGGSRRFGSAKALAHFRGEAMVLRAIRILEPVCREVVVVSSVSEVTAGLEGAPLAVSVLPDRVPGAGPLAGLEAALLHAREREADGVFLLGCDMPLVSPGLVAAVARAGPESGRPAAVITSAGGRPEPLCGWYGLDCLPTVERRLTGEDRSMEGLLAALDAHRIPDEALPEGTRPELELRSANTPDELARLEGSPPPPAVCVVGFKDSGKTGVAVGLVAELRTRGRRVGALKHGHNFRLDTPGTDSWRLTHEGGADPVLLAGPSGFAWMGSWGPGDEPGLEELLACHFSDVDMVVVEGYKGETLPKVEVHRVGSGAPLLSRGEGPGAGPFLALVVDEPAGLDGSGPVPVLSRDAADLAPRLADLVEEALFGSRPTSEEGR